MDIKDFVNVRTIESVKLDLADRIKSRRKKMKVSQKLLSRISGVSYASIRKFESSGEISLRSLLMIANALNFLIDFDMIATSIVITNLKEYKPDDNKL